MFRILPLLHPYANGEEIQLYVHHTVLKIHALQGLSYHLGYITPTNASLYCRLIDSTLILVLFLLLHCILHVC